MAKEIERDFAMDYDAMLERAQLFHDNFDIDKSDFTTLFPTLDDPFNADFQSIIDTADAIPSGSSVDNEIKQITEELNTAMEVGRKAVQVLFTYASMKWNSKAKVEEFGKAKYAKARQSQRKLPELIEEAIEAYNKGTNAADLLTQGYTQAMADDLEDKGEAIETLNRDQEVLKSERGRKTENRVKAFNTVWSEMKKINQASKVVYADSPAGIEKYLLYPTVHSGLAKAQNLVATPNPSLPEEIWLTWEPVIDATSYELYGSQVNIGEAAGEFSKINEVTIESDTQTIESGFRYYYKVRGINPEKVGGFSDEVWVEL